LQASENKIMISHGTDTMVATARQLAKTVNDKTLVLFGAMIPYSLGHSDALFNFGCAISAIQLLGCGVFICMNGKIFDWDNVQKLTDAGRFDILRDV